MKLNPANADAFVEMGNAKSRLGYHNEAIEDQVRAMQADPAYTALAFYNIACNYSQMNNKNAMLDFLNKCKKKKYFKEQNRYEQFLQDKDFDNFRKDADFMKFQKKLLKN